MTTAHVLCAGESLIDITTDNDQSSYHVGGSVLNVALGLARQDVSTVLASAWARDEFGTMIDDKLTAGGVDTGGSRGGIETTNVAHAHLDEEGKATYDFDLTNVIADVSLANVDHLHIGSIGAFLEPGRSTCLQLATEARQSGVSVSYDINARPTLMGEADEALNAINEVIALSDIIKASDDDVAWLYPGRSLTSVAEEWLTHGHLAIITMGGAGTFVHGRGWDEPVTMPALNVSVIDTVGAGDSFMAGFLSFLAHEGLLGSATPTRDQVVSAVNHAMGTAAITVTHAGAYAPTRSEIREILR